MRQSKTIIWDRSSWKIRLLLRFSRQFLHAQLSGTPPTSATPNADGTLPRNIPTARMGRRLLPWLERGRRCHDGPSTQRFLCLRCTRRRSQACRVIEDGVVKDLLMTRIPRAEFTESTGMLGPSGGDRYVAFPSVVTVKLKRYTNERAVQKGVQLAKQTGNDYVFVIKTSNPRPL